MARRRRGTGGDRRTAATIRQTATARRRLSGGATKEKRGGRRKGKEGRPHRRGPTGVEGDDGDRRRGTMEGGRQAADGVRDDLRNEMGKIREGERETIEGGNAGRRRWPWRLIPAHDGDGAPAANLDGGGVDEVDLGRANPTAAAARCGGGWVHGAGAMESSGEAGGKRENEEEDAGMDYIGAERSGTAGSGPISPADVGEWERREREAGFENRIPATSGARASGRGG
uniref:Retrotransposon protein, putative, Ty3-gypsy subclass n=2 Tax=Oryza sativa subsp. japonica TaxID=39947 RepID=Q75LY5_ORYSJ|nr:hypothetical protein [Oryza sativa Japonica Group]ABF98149.1 retrotransposon protein, putative, Ty3-gypsy subclass [Oryza sativa Japonica Group]